MSSLALELSIELGEWKEVDGDQRVGGAEKCWGFGQFAASLLCVRHSSLEFSALRTMRGERGDERANIWTVRSVVLLV